VHNTFGSNLNYPKIQPFANWLNKIDFPIKPITQFISLMAKFNVVIGIGKGETLFDRVKDGAIKAEDAIKKISLANLKQDIASAAHSLVLFAVNSAIVFKSLKDGINRESAFSQASRTIEGTNEQIKSLKKTLDDLASTDLSVTTEELYAVAGVAGAMGKAVEDIPQFVRTVSEGVIALNIPAEELAQRLGTLQTQLNLSEEGLVSLSDQVNTVADTLPGKVSELDVFEVLSRGVATAGKNFGLLKGETVGLTGALLSLGEAPETARTSIVNLLSSLQNAKNQTKDFQLGLGMMGTSADKLAVDIKAKPLPALMQLLDTMNGMSKASRLDIATKLLGKGQDAIALAKLVDNTTLLKEAIKQATDETVYSGSVHAAYQKQIVTTDAKITLLKNATANFSESLTSTFLPAVQSVIDVFRYLVNAAASFSQNHPIFKTFAAVSVTVLSLAGLLRLLRLAFNAVGLMPASIMPRLAALGATLVALNANVIATTASLWTLARTGSAFSVFKTALSFLFGGVLGAAVGSLALLTIGIANLLPVTTKWGETTATVGEIIAAMWKTIVDGFQPITAIFKQAVSDLDAWLESVGIANGIVGLLSESIKFIGIAIVQAGGYFKAFGETIGNVFAFAVQSASDFQTALDDIFSGKGVGNSLSAYIEKTKNNIVQLNNAFRESAEGAKNAFATFEQATSKNLQKGKKSTLDKPDARPLDTGSDLPATVDEGVAKQVESAAKLEKEISDRKIQILREEETQKLQILAQSALSKKQIDDLVFQQKLATETAISQTINQRLQKEIADIQAAELQKRTLSNDELAAKRTSLIEIEKAYGQQISNLLALEKEHRDRSVGYLKEIEQLQQTQTANLSQLDELGLSKAQIAENKKRQLVTDTAKLKELIANGEYEKATELGKKSQALALDLAKTEKQIDVERGWNWTNARVAREKYNETVDLTKQALTQASAAEIQQANIAREEAQKRMLSLAGVRNLIADIEQAASKGTQLTVSADISQVLQAKADIQKPTSSTHTIYVQKVERNSTGGLVGGYAEGGFIKRQGQVTGKGTGTSDEIPAMLSNGEYVIKADKVQQYGKATFDAINYGNNPVAIAHYAEGGLVEKLAEERQKKKEEVFSYFDKPTVQISWSYSGGQIASHDKFYKNAEAYLAKQGLPIEWLREYQQRLTLSKNVASAKTLDDKTKASVAFDDYAASKNETTSAALPAVNKQSVTLPQISSPAVSTSSASIDGAPAKTVKFVLPDGNTANGKFKESDTAFFDKLSEISGVTKK
jgi:TP901 family phage tail tape measure protein